MNEEDWYFAAALIEVTALLVIVLYQIFFKIL